MHIVQTQKSFMISKNLVIGLF